MSHGGLDRAEGPRSPDLGEGGTGDTGARTERAFAPLLLLADSAPLFATAVDPSVLERALPHLPADPCAAYLGAANGDQPASYDLFAAAMAAAGIARRCLVRSVFAAEDRDRLAAADLVVLAGGDVARGWRIFERTGMSEMLRRRRAAGAVLLGVSAGAVHLGWSHLGLIAARIGAHEDADDWQTLEARVRQGRPPVRGLGLPAGGALICQADGTVAALRRPIIELLPAAGGVRRRLLSPTADDGGIRPAGPAPASTR